MTDALLPPDPSRDGWYWVTSEDDGETFPLRWTASHKAWEYGADIWSPGATLNCGYRLASRHPIPTPEQLDVLHALPVDMVKQAQIDAAGSGLSEEQTRYWVQSAVCYSADLIAALGAKP